VVAAHVFVADLAPADGGDLVLDDVDRHHLERVLRLRAGEAVSASDGRGGVRVCAFAGGGAGRLEPVGEVDRQPAPAPSVGVGFALVKGTKPEWIVQKLTECGVDRILPFVGERSVVRWDEDKADRHLERWRRVAVEAAMQSRRCWLPEVAGVRSFAALLAVAPEAALADGGPADDGPAVPLDADRTPTVLVGPEGGWSDAERALAVGGGHPFVRFGPTVLRAETAAVAAGVLLGALRSGAVSAAEPRVPRS
jgi:16S rRNA (uracil1498-N3)-methyltransferase